MTTIHDILAEFREAATGKRDLGDKFERLFANFLVTDPQYQDRFSDVWMWSEWPGRGNQPDTGIDLVAKERYTGELCAIQCKFYDPAHRLEKSDLDSFFATSGKHPFTSRIVVSTTDEWSKHAEELLSNQQVQTNRIRVQDLENSAVDWSQFSLKRPDRMKLRPKKSLRPHQAKALTAVMAGLASADRGKLIMACGTGKTFTSLKIAERFAAARKQATECRVLFLVPSIALLAQSLSEWTAESATPMHCFAVCSDTAVGKVRDNEDIRLHDLPFPATTDARKLAQQMAALAGRSRLTVIFSTYQSIATIHEAQAKFGAPTFDLVICDEAHRTTGVTLAGTDESHFVKVHDAAYIRAAKRLYMTATPRIFADSAKSKAEEAEAVVCSMDDPAVYGLELHRLGFGEAVGAGLLADYKVMVLAVDEKFVSKTFQRQLAKDGELNMEDAVRITGCWNGLAKRLAVAAGNSTAGVENDPTPMRRAVAFSRSIKDSQRITELFAGVVDEYIARAAEEERDGLLRCEADHVDGTMNALKRGAKLDWLKADTSAQGAVCRILSNARCLSEGVDVPALDAVLFLNPRNSVVDVVQSVGRVMRVSPGKRYGYIILPVGVPADVPPEVALQDNEKYKVIWQVLQALRAHDDRFNATVNQLELNKARPESIQVIGVGVRESDAEYAVGDGAGTAKALQSSFTLPHIEEWRDAIFAKVVLKCGDRRYWESWAADVSKIAERQVTRIRALLESADEKPRQAFDKFVAGLRSNLNPAVSRDDAIEMLAQHLITQPVFDALFEGYAFTQKNPVSRSMDAMLKLLHREGLAKEQEQLEKFYASVRLRASGIDNAEGKQRIIVELYDKFFRTAFPRMAERLGIVYTPVEVVDFILKSADDALREEFGVGLTSEGVHVLDPFTGTGTFIVRLLQQSGMIAPQDLARKYAKELHANEIVLLAYYIAAVNIEAAWHGRMLATEKAAGYMPFEGIVLTDTFQLTEGRGAFEELMFPDNNKRAKRQKAMDIRVIVGNPPYSAQQDSENDDNKNLKYPTLDERIRRTYAARSNAGLLKNLYDSYIRAIRWASDRIKERGVVCFVTNGSFIDANNMDGLRKCLADEFSRVYVFNLRGNARTQGEQRRMEAGSVFGAGTRTPVAITLLVKNPDKPADGLIHYNDIGDYLSREDKLNMVRDVGRIARLPLRNLTPNEHGDWLNQRDPAFDAFVRLGDKDDDKGMRLFATYSQGVLTARDAWAYNFSANKLAANMGRMIAFYNEQRGVYEKTVKRAAGETPTVEDVIDTDSKKISWTHNVKEDLRKLKVHEFNEGNVVKSLYRPFTKARLYFNRRFNERVYQMPRLFPQPGLVNLVVSALGVGATKPFSALITDALPDYEAISKGQCFPLYYYSEREVGSVSGAVHVEYERHDAITDAALAVFRKTYAAIHSASSKAGGDIGKEDLFYYVYGVLHSPEYKKRFESDLKKQLPRIPYARDFWAFSTAGRALARWHLDYETVEPYPLQQGGELDLGDPALYRVQRMAFARSRVNGTLTDDKTTIIYNARIRLSSIPLEAYDYIVNGKPALEWVMERYQMTTDKDSGITNDPNDWAIEHSDPQYILNLVKRVVRVSVETVKIVKSLPALDEFSTPDAE